MKGTKVDKGRAKTLGRETMRKEKYSEEKNSLKGIQAEENENHNGKEAGGEYSKRKYAEWDIL